MLRLAWRRLLVTLRADRSPFATASDRRASQESKDSDAENSVQGRGRSTDDPSAPARADPDGPILSALGIFMSAVPMCGDDYPWCACADADYIPYCSCADANGLYEDLPSEMAGTIASLPRADAPQGGGLESAVRSGMGVPPLPLFLFPGASTSEGDREAMQMMTASKRRALLEMAGASSPQECSEKAAALPEKLPNMRSMRQFNADALGGSSSKSVAKTAAGRAGGSGGVRPSLVDAAVASGEPVCGECGGRIRPSLMRTPAWALRHPADDRGLEQGTTDGSFIGGFDVSVPFSAHLVPDRRVPGGRRQMALPSQSNIMESLEPVYEGVKVPSRDEGSRAVTRWRLLEEHWRKLVLTAVFATILVVVIPTAIAYGRSQSNSAPLSALSSSENFFRVKAKLQSLMGSAAWVLEDASSPQHGALYWVADKDERRVSWEDERSLMQRFVLATVFFSTGGEESWSASCRFLSSEHECSWNQEIAEYGQKEKGVICLDDNVTVAGINIPLNNVSGVLPEEVSFLTSLKSINLRGNNLAGPIPDTLGKLQRLQYLDLEGNHLTGTIPSLLGSLSEMQQLFLNENALTGPIPTSLGHLSNLTDLWLGYNDLTNTIPGDLNGLTKLEYLFLDSNSFTGTIPFTPSSLPHLQHLEVAEVAENFLTGSLPSSIFIFQNLRKVDLWGNVLTGNLPAEVGNLAPLEVLEVSENIMNGSIPSSLGSLNKLVWLSLLGNSFSGTVPSEVGKLSQLRVLYLNHNRLNGTLPNTIGDLTLIEELTLGVNNLSGTIPQSVSKLTSLYSLTLENNSFTGDLDFLCHIPLSLFMADCYGESPEVSCKCCNSCCSDELGPAGPVYGCFAP